MTIDSRNWKPHDQKRRMKGRARYLANLIGVVYCIEYIRLVVCSYVPISHNLHKFRPASPSGKEKKKQSSPFPCTMARLAIARPKCLLERHS